MLEVIDPTDISKPPRLLQGGEETGEGEEGAAAAAGAMSETGGSEGGGDVDGPENDLKQLFERVKDEVTAKRDGARRRLKRRPRPTPTPNPTLDREPDRERDS